MGTYRIVVADSSESSRTKICSFLNKRGYTTFQATDGPSALRITRSLYPDLVLMDLNLWGMNAYEAAEVIESDRLSSVLFITGNPDSTFYGKLEKRSIFAYISKPVQPEQLYQIVEFAVNNAARMKVMEARIETLEATLENRKKIEQAKGLLIEQLKINEKKHMGYFAKEVWMTALPWKSSQTGSSASLSINKLADGAEQIGSGQVGSF